MKNTILKLLYSKRTALVMCGILSLFGMTQTANADCITAQGQDPSVFALAIDATSSCANLSGNNSMFGCDIGASGSCMITNGSDSITVSITSGGVGSTTPINWEITGSSDNDLIDFVIVGGAANGSSTCGYSYTPGSDFGAGLIFEKSNGSNQKVTSLSVCSDFTQPLPSEPRLILKKTVTKAVSADPVADCAAGQDLVEVNAGDEVRYCYTVENVGVGLAENVTLEDDEGTPGSTITVALTGLNNDGSLNTGATATGSMLATLLEAGSLVNTATAEAYGLGGTMMVTATDTATVKTQQVAEICPPNYQEGVNQLSLATGLDFAFLQDPNQSGRRSVCVPNGANGAANTIRVACVDQCIVKPVCETNPDDPACSPSVCEESGAWTTGAGAQCSVVQNPPEGVHPYCWEVQQDLNKDCTLNEWEPQEETILNIKKGHANPYVYQSCYSSGGRYVCETMCFSFSAADALACPPGSTVF